MSSQKQGRQLQQAQKRRGAVQKRGLYADDPDGLLAELQPGGLMDSGRSCNYFWCLGSVCMVNDVDFPAHLLCLMCSAALSLASGRYLPESTMLLEQFVRLALHHVFLNMLELTKSGGCSALSLDSGWKPWNGSG